MQQKHFQGIRYTMKHSEDSQQSTSGESGTTVTVDSELLTLACSLSFPILLLGDFNIHVDAVCSNTNQLLSVFECFNLTQHVHFSTHTCGHILDLICTSRVDICSISSSDTGISDHKLLDFSLSLPMSKKMP